MYGFLQPSRNRADLAGRRPFLLRRRIRVHTVPNTGIMKDFAEIIRSSNNIFIFRRKNFDAAVEFCV